MNKLRMSSVLLLLSVLVASCTPEPITGRPQLLLVSNSTLNRESFQAYQDFLGDHKLSSDPQATAMVKRVGQRVQKAVEEYFIRQGEPNRLDGYQWEFNLVESPEVNAWCMPGGKVVVYSGLLRVAKDEAGLAVVVGHEIAHAVANHGNERLSHQLVVNLGASVLEEALSQKPAQTRQVMMAAFGAGAEVGVILPYSRGQENAADRMGLIFMAMAGYDPRAAVSFWERMTASSKGARTPEFLSTHPSDQTRINNIRHLAETEAVRYYKPAPG